MLGQYILIVSTVVSTVVGFLVFYNNSKSSIHRLYGLLTIVFVLLSLANFFSLEPSPEQPFYARTVMAVTSLGLYLLYLLALCLKFPSFKFKQVNKTLLLFTLAIVIYDYSPLLFSEVVAASPAKPVPAFGAPIFLIHFIIMVALTAKHLISGLKTSDQKRSMQFRLVLFGTIPIILIAPVTGFILPLVVGESSLIVLTPMYTSFFVVCVGYAMAKHGLFDIKLAAVRSAAYLFSLMSLGLIYYMLAYIVSVTLFQGQTTSSVSVSPINILLALILAFAFQPIKQFFDKLTDSIFYKDRYQTDDFFAEFSELLASTTDLRGLLERASQQIAATFKTEQAFFLLYYTNGKRHHMSAGTAKHSRMPMDDALILDQTVAMNGDAIIITHMLPEQSELRRMLVSHKITLVMPLVHADNGIGYVFLGEQRTGSYTKRDLKVLTTVADELIIAIQNALSVHEIKEINATLQQRIDVATKELRSSNSQLRHLDEVKDEFISMASHQLRTPLTSIKGYISMVLEGDMGKITPQQHVVLTESFNSSERMVRLIADFLNVSRLQTGKFIIEKNPVDIVGVVSGEVSSLQMIAKSHDMKLVFRAAKDSIIIAIDEAKVRQVIMNFIDNAIYYSRANSTITVNIEAKSDVVNFTVVDAGIGVPLEEQAMLFNKFFRAKNARKQRPDGTGVGLYLAKKVITAHNGKMIFASNAGEGSTFGFSIPIKQETKTDVLTQ